MELKLNDGRYSVCGGDLATVSGAAELMQRITMKLTARRGKFWPLPDYGSRLYTLVSSVAPRDRDTAIREFVAEALYGESVNLDSIESDVQGDTLYLRLGFSYKGGSFTVDTAIREDI